MDHKKEKEKKNQKTRINLDMLTKETEKDKSKRSILAGINLALAYFQGIPTVGTLDG